jgi:hypothetical protein
VDLDEHRNRHQPLSALAPMAQTVLATLARRMAQEGRLSDAEDSAAALDAAATPDGSAAMPDGAPPERPPLDAVRVA